MHNRSVPSNYVKIDSTKTILLKALETYVVYHDYIVKGTFVSIVSKNIRLNFIMVDMCYLYKQTVLNDLNRNNKISFLLPYLLILKV